ncbi:M14 family zinc carboxypeptidase [Mycoplasmatota bacterium WC44]
MKQKQLIVNTDNTYYLDQVYEDIDDLVNIYSEFSQKEIVGKSVENRDIVAIKVGILDNNKKPSILLMGGTHAREDFSVMLVMKMLNYILYYLDENEKWDKYDVQAVMSKVNIYFVPVLNPDGLNIVHNGLKNSKNYNFLQSIPMLGGKSDYWKANANGVDLNMNFDDGNWFIRKNRDDVDTFASEGFKGTKPDSEPEVKSIKTFCERNKFLISVTYHCSGEVVFWADKGTHSEFKGVDENIIDRFTNNTGYKKCRISENPAKYSCGFENWFRVRYQRPSFCIELSPYPGEPFIQHDDNKFNKLVWNKVKHSGLFFATEAISLSEIMYDIYSSNKFIRSFYDIKDASSFIKSHDGLFIQR